MSSGWLPYPLRLDPREPDPVLHPTDLEKTMLTSMSIPLLQARPFTRSSAIPRSLSLSSDLVNHLASTSSNDFFARTTRLAPPGPLGVHGETLPFLLAPVEDYDPTNLSKVQEGRLVQYGFEWRQAEPASCELPKAREMPVRPEPRSGLEFLSQAALEEAINVDAEPMQIDEEVAPVANGLVEGVQEQAEEQVQGEDTEMTNDHADEEAPADFGEIEQPAQEEQPPPKRASLSLRFSIPAASHPSPVPSANSRQASPVPTSLPAANSPLVIEETVPQPLTNGDLSAPIESAPQAEPTIDGPMFSEQMFFEEVLPEPIQKPVEIQEPEIQPVIEQEPEILQFERQVTPPVEISRPAIPKLKLSLSPRKPKTPTPEPVFEDVASNQSEAMSDFGDPFSQFDQPLVAQEFAKSPTPPPAPPVDKPKLSFKLKLGGLKPVVKQEPVAMQVDEVQQQPQNSHQWLV